MNRLTELADRLKGTKSHPDFLAALDETITILLAAAQETVGTEWSNHPDGKLMCNAFADASHNREIAAAHVAIAALKAERDAARRGGGA